MKLTKLNDLIEDDKVVKGSWDLGPNHELLYRAKGSEEEIKLKASLIAAEEAALLFSITERQSDQKTTTSIARLNGSWSLDSKNRIIFLVEKEKSNTDTLTFQGEWEVNKNNELIYTYEEKDLKRGKKISQELIFKGFWDLSQKNRLVYSMGQNSESAFRFRGAFQTKSILAKKGEIRYQAGAEVSGKKKIQTICLFGKWKISRDLGLSFEITYSDNQKRSISFGGEYALSSTSSIEVNLKSKSGEPLGIELILTKDIFEGDGQVFVRLQRSLEDSRIEAGAKFKW